MAILFKVVDPNESGASGTQCLIKDWNKRVICQEDTDEMLTCSSNSTNVTDGAVYKAVDGHNKISCLPSTLKLLQTG